MGPRIAWVGLTLLFAGFSVGWLAARVVDTQRVRSSVEHPSMAVADDAAETTQDSFARPPAPIERAAPLSGLAPTLTASIPEATAAKAPEESETWEFVGSVRDEATNNPCPGFRVISSDGMAAVTNVRGQFRIDVPHSRNAPGDYKTWFVYSPEGACVATRRLALVPGVVILADGVALMHGRVVDPSGRPAPVQGVMISAGGTRGFTATDVSALDGGFRAYLAQQATLAEMVELTFTIDTSLYPVLCRTSELLRPEGATVVLDLCRVELQVSTPEGTDTGDVELNAYVLRAGSTSHDRIDGLLLDEHGHLELMVERGWRGLTVQVGGQGWAPWVESRTLMPCGQTWTVPLTKLEPEDVVSGRVLSADGEPLGLVSLRLRSDINDLELRDMLRSDVFRSELDGHFSIPLARGSAAWIEAGGGGPHPRLLARVRGGEQDLELRFEPVQRVTIALLDEAGQELVGEFSRASYLLFGADNRPDFDMAESSPIQLAPLPPGSYAIAVFKDEPSLFAYLTLDVVAGRDLYLDATLRKGYTTTGRVLDATGEPIPGALVRLADPPWAAFGTRANFATRTRPDGSFRVSLTDRPTAEIEISRVGGVPLRVQVQADTPATWTLP